MLSTEEEYDSELNNSSDEESVLLNRLKRKFSRIVRRLRRTCSVEKPRDNSSSSSKWNIGTYAIRRAVGSCSSREASWIEGSLVRTTQAKTYQSLAYEALIERPYMRLPTYLCETEFRNAFLAHRRSVQRYYNILLTRKGRLGF